MIIALAAEYISIETFTAGRHFAEHWGAPPIAFHMQAAHLGTFNVQGGVDRHSPHMQDMQTNTSASTALALRQLRRELLHEQPAVHVQARALRILSTSTMSVQEWGVFLSRRFFAFMIGSDKTKVEEIAWNKVFMLMNMCSKHHAMAIIKTLSGSWCTSARFHEDTDITCVYGCTGDSGDTDSMQHYLYCPRLWSYISVQANTSCPSSPAGRLGLSPPSLRGLTATLIAFTSYHSLKIGHRSAVERAQEHGDG